MKCKHGETSCVLCTQCDLETIEAHEGFTVGITGTRKGCTKVQMEYLKNAMENLKGLAATKETFVELHHGDCIGVDAEVYFTARKVFSGGAINLITVCHPPSDPKHRAFTHNTQNREQKPYLERNMDIVDESDWLFALPAESHEKKRGGTWSTIRYARKQGKYILLITPAGAVKEINKVEPQ